jgi:hypothetical protein
MQGPMKTPNLQIEGKETLRENKRLLQNEYF